MIRPLVLFCFYFPTPKNTPTPLSLYGFPPKSPGFVAPSPRGGPALGTLSQATKKNLRNLCFSFSVVTINSYKKTTIRIFFFKDRFCSRLMTHLERLYRFFRFGEVQFLGSFWNKLNLQTNKHETLSPWTATWNSCGLVWAPSQSPPRKKKLPPKPRLLPLTLLQWTQKKTCWPTISQPFFCEKLPFLIPPQHPQTKHRKRHWDATLGHWQIATGSTHRDVDLWSGSLKVEGSWSGSCWYTPEI